ncbi:MAG: hypothetical protein LQ345_003698 [Seirophora villosa]|nr:MAG: hypothetical protein LQ345_003698 [Seirophora villosa]
MKSMANGRHVEPFIGAVTQTPSNAAASRSGPLKNNLTPSESTNGNSKDTPRDQKDGSVNSDSPLSDGVKALLEGQRKDIDRIMANVDNLLQDMKTMKASMDYLKFQQKTFASFAEQEDAKSPTAITEDLQTLTERVSHVITKIQKVDTLADNVRTLDRNVCEAKAKLVDMDGLAENLRELSKTFSRLDAKANEVGELKLELKAMSGRIQRLEEANGDRLKSNLASNSEVSSRSSAQNVAEPTYHATGSLQEVPSSTRSHPENVAIGRRNSDVTNSVGEDRSDSFFDKGRQQSPIQGQNLMVQDTTGQGDLVELLRITSAQKVAAQKRRLSQDSSSSSSSQSPQHKRRPGYESRIDGTPDWNTKPKHGSARRRKLTSLNDPNRVLLSDPEDSDFDPSSLRLDSTIPHVAKDRTKAPVRLPTPEWERSDREGSQTAFANSSSSSNTRGRFPSRRGVSGRGPLPDRKTLHRRSGGAGYVSALSPGYWEDEASTSPPDLIEKPRDSEGRLLRSDGKIDGRSLRHRQQQREAAEAKAKAKAKAKANDDNLTPLLKLGPLWPVAAAQQGVDQPLQAGAPELQPANNNLALPPPPPLALSSTQAAAPQYVDAAALNAAGYTVLSTTTNPSNPNDPSAAAASSTVTVTPMITSAEQNQGPAADDSTAATIAVKQGKGDDNHAKLMSKVFPWR